MATVEDSVKNPLKRSLEETKASSPEVSDRSAQFTPRGYQQEVYDVAVKRNTIALLETGAGKTMIAVMLIKQIGEAMKSAGDRKLIVFLAPTVNLVNQQFNVIKEKTNLRVGEYFGAKGIDEWKAENWKKEIDEQDVIVLTPQILLDTLRKAFLSLEDVCLLILDECHRATGKHPYARIMKEFYDKSSNKPKIFGMTASPVVSKGASSMANCESKIAELESILDSQVYTVEDKAELETFIPSAKETCRFYDQFQFPSDSLKEKIQATFSKHDTSLSRMKDSSESHCEDMEDKLKTLRKRLSCDHAKIMFCLNDLGLICAYEAVKDYLESASDGQENEISAEGSTKRKLYFEEVLNIIGSSMYIGNGNSAELISDYAEAVKLGHISPKLCELLLIFQSFRETDNVLCLIFVERIITAKVIDRLVKKVNSLTHFSVSYLTGTGTSVDSLAPDVQREVLKTFRSGKVNLLFATDVIEEGLDVPNCSYVIRFDLPKSVRSYIQSRGRARQDNSQYIMMVERGNGKQRKELFDIIRSECSVNDTALSRVPTTYKSKGFTLQQQKDTYVVDATGASVSTDSSISLLYRYCEKLPHEKYFTPKPVFHLTTADGGTQCTLTLPPNGAFKTIVGPVSRSSRSAKQRVCLEACKKLHQMDALDHHLIPAVESAPAKVLPEKTKESPTSGAGSTKRKELHGTTPVRALSGTWKENTDGATFHAYKFEFSCSNVNVIYSGFVLLLESKLEDDVGNVDIDLYLLSKMVKATVSSCGPVHLDQEQMMKAKLFQEFFFNGMFGRLFVGSKTVKKPRKFVMQNGAKSLWIPSYMYLLLPINTREAETDETLKINWGAIDSCIPVIEFLKVYSLPTRTKDEMLNMPRNGSDVADEMAPGEKKLVFSNGLFDYDDLKYKVVVAIHTGRIYTVLEVDADKNAETPFVESRSNKKQSYKSHAEYFYKKYGIVLKYLKQQLLRLKHSHNPHNLLVDFHDVAKSEGGPANRKPVDHAFMPPELLHTIDTPVSVLRTLYLLPSLMHRVESLMLASQLKEEINFQSEGFSISTSLVLEAITALRCNESFSMERLELLGDSVMKYTVSCHLYLKYPKKDEGQLSDHRSSVVSNANLHKCGTSRKIQGYIRDCPFDPRRWVVPGQITRFPDPCSCDVDSAEVPLDPKFQSMDPKVKLGKLCDKGHRWLISKAISDCLEAVIGAYYVAGGLVAALHVMRWFGMDVELDPLFVVEAINSASLHSIAPKIADEIKPLESKIGYEFSVKGLLLEAITHPSCQDEEARYCYQRLEFLGDSVLDVLITWHLYQSHSDVDPGELTDLRSASVNNESFAQAALKRNLEVHLQHSSSLLLTQIKEYVELCQGSDADKRLLQGSKGPKALGDMVESIAGAILLDTKLNLDEVWRIFKPILSPIVTPEKLELAPFRELSELCDHLGYFIKGKCETREDIVHAEIRLQLKDDLLIGQGQDRSQKEAKGKAALRVLRKLECKGITCSRVLRKRKESSDPAGETELKLEGGISIETGEGDALDRPDSTKRRKTVSLSQGCEDRVVDLACLALTESNSDAPTPVVGPIDTKKGRPRSILYELCKNQQWPMPEFDTDEEKFRTAIEFDDGVEKRKGFSSFTSTINLYIPNCGSIRSTGKARPDKKSSYDSAALEVIHELEKQGRIIISE